MNWPNAREWGWRKTWFALSKLRKVTHSKKISVVHRLGVFLP